MCGGEGGEVGEADETGAAGGTREAVCRGGQDDGGDAPLRGEAVSLLGLGVKRRSDSRLGAERPTRIHVAAADPAAHFMRETRSSRAMHA